MPWGRFTVRKIVGFGRMNVGRIVLFIAALVGLGSVPYAADAATAGEGENCDACEAVLDLALAHPRRAADREARCVAPPGRNAGLLPRAPGA